MQPEQPDVRAQLHALIPDEADRAALWTSAWNAYYERYNDFRDENPGWRAFFTAHHGSALDAALLALLPQVIDRGVAEGRRQAVVAVAEAIGLSNPDDVHPDERLSRFTFGDLRRLVGPRGPAEQAEPARCPCCFAEQGGCRCGDAFDDDPADPGDWLCNDASCDRRIARLARPAAERPEGSDRG